jgi:ABC-type ATPase with predicted acetyltransferase domain
MPSFDILKKINAKKSFRVSAVMGMFDLQSEKIREYFAGEIPIEKENWHIGVIVGRSGTGKTTIAKELFSEEYITHFDYSAKSILDDMPKEKSTKEICATFNSVGFSSPPSWLKPYFVLSTGEKMRVDLARALLSEKKLIVFDEFTSVVDRTVAQIGSAAIAKAIRRSEKKFIAVTCHEDIIKWLEPDWVFYTNDMRFVKKNGEDRKSKRKSINARAIFGTYLESITI